MPRKILTAYYAATVLFLLLDYSLDINVRIAFFAGNSEAKAVYYFVLFVCFAVVLWRPAWSTVIGGIESLATIVLLIISMYVRSVIYFPTIDGFEDPNYPGPVTVAEIINFLIAGGAAYVSFQQGLRSLVGGPLGPNR